MKLFDRTDVVFSYSRSQAIEDGVLIDVSDMAKEAGITYPVAITANVKQFLEFCKAEDQDFDGRLWDLLTLFRVSAKNKKGAVVHFSPYFLMNDGKLHKIPMWAKCGPGDKAELVITIMLNGED